MAASRRPPLLFGLLLVTLAWSALRSEARATAPVGTPASQPITIAECSAAGVGIEALELPLSKNMRTFYGGKLTVLRVNTEEPAGSPMGLAIVLPTVAEEPGGGGQQCVAVLRFAAVDLPRATSSYDARKGLLLTVPVQLFDPETSTTAPGPPLRLRVDLRRGRVRHEASATAR